MTIIEQLTYLYENKLPKVNPMLEHNEAVKYFERLMLAGNIITIVRDDKICGFLEYWRITPEQFGRLCLNITLAHEEDLLSGKVALISRMWISEDERGGEAFSVLASMFLTRNSDATHFAAFQQQKRHKPVQVYTRAEIIKHYRMEK